MIYCKRTNSTFNLSLILAGERTVKFQLDKPGGLPPDARIAFKVKTNNYYRFSIVPNTGYLPCEVTGTFLIRKKSRVTAFVTASTFSLFQLASNQDRIELGQSKHANI